MNEISSTIIYSLKVLFLGGMGMHLYNKLSTLIPTIYNGGINSFSRHEFDCAHNGKYNPANTYEWIETIFGRKYETGSFMKYNGLTWTISYIRDYNDTVVEISLIRTSGRDLYDETLYLPRQQLSAMHRG